VDQPHDVLFHPVIQVHVRMIESELQENHP
jgi:hypothetical protein